MYRISKEFHFNAAHHLGYLEEGHPCARVHGHNYVVVLGFAAAGLDDAGMVLDYGKMAPFGNWLDAEVDHRDLNDLVHQPTAEVLAAFFYEKARSLHLPVVRVEVRETPKTSAVYEP